MTSKKVVTYEPRGAAARLFSTRDPEVLLSGPAGTGKSMAALWRLHMACLKYPGIKCLIVRKTAVSLTNTTLDSYRRKVAQHAISCGLVRWYGGSGAEPAAFRYTNGSEIRVGGMDKPEKVLSSEYDMIFCDEATELSVEDWETLGSRLRNGVLPWQQQIAACNPSFPTHWIKQRADNGVMTSLASVHADNPAYVNRDGTYTPAGQAYLGPGGALDRMTGTTRQRLKDGVWVAAEGIVYTDYRDSVHLIDPFEIPENWTRWWSVDFGFTNPFVCQFWAEDPDGRLYLYREIYRTRTMVEDHARHILSLIGDERRPDAIICDHDAEGRATLERYLDMSTKAATKDKAPGIQAVQARMRDAGDGRPRIFFFRDAVVERDPQLVEESKPTCTVAEIGGYVWDTSGTKGIKEEPVKRDDHGQDAMRYMVAELDLGRRPRFRSFGY